MTGTYCIEKKRKRGKKEHASGFEPATRHVPRGSCIHPAHCRPAPANVAAFSFITGPEIFSLLEELSSLAIRLSVWP